MGCDIHLHIEIKIADKWEHYGQPHVDRHYALFEKMAGVRGCVGQAVVPPKGLPPDPTGITLLHWQTMLGDGHTPSWLNCAEIQELIHWCNSQGGLRNSMDLEMHILHSYLFNNAFVWEGKPGGKDAGIQDVRFVFWFDN